VILDAGRCYFDPRPLRQEVSDRLMAPFPLPVKGGTHYQAAEVESSISEPTVIDKYTTYKLKVKCERPHLGRFDQ